MSKTLELLRGEFATPCPTLSAVRERYFSHLSNDRALLQRINKGKIALKVTRTGGTRQGQPVVYLNDLATYLDSIADKAA
ncbi:pyocin activator PrtN family protein [Pseudomonas sp. LJDD11]|uniref:pyocin activator PrtN family protein n=1 Tax=Pseudomonas sp. LJDD11 TaxID=2931984 RepID=UPI00211BACD0|nr:pyocin activator PrtN family protein [Pseudomonas sp. LJDD11]